MGEPQFDEGQDLRLEVARLEGEVDRLRHALGELHCTDVNALRRAYRTLCQHVDALDQESAGMLGELRDFETDVLTPDIIATELGTTTALAVGLSIVHQALKVTPLGGVRWLFTGMWTLGGAYVVWRFAAGTLARVTGMLGRNAQRKRDLAAKLEVVEARIHIMASLLNWAEARKSPFPSPSPSHEGPLQQLVQQAQQAQQAAARQGPPAPPGGAAAAAGPARSAGSSSPELVPAPPRVLVGRGPEGSPSFGTPTHSRSPSHSPPKAQRSAAAAAVATGGIGAGADSMAPGAVAPSTSGPGGPGSAASPSSSGGSGGRPAGGASPGRPDLSMEMESLMRYAQLGSAGRGSSPSPSGASSSAGRLATP